MLSKKEKQYHFEKFKELIFEKYSINQINEIFLDDTNLIRLLIAKEFKLAEVFIMFEDINKWRNIELSKYLYKIDSIKEIKNLFPSYWLCTDKLGNPVHVECPGVCSMPKLLETTTMHTLISMYIKNNEFMITNLCPKLSIEGEIKRTISIIDLKGISISSINSGLYTYLKNIICIGNQYYPETMSKMFIINAPFMFYTVWRVLKSFIPQRTLNKVHILSKGKETLLYEFIDKDKLPNNLNFSEYMDDSNLEKEYRKSLNL